MLTKVGMCHPSGPTCVVRYSKITATHGSPGLHKQHDAAADHHKRRKVLRQADMLLQRRNAFTCLIQVIVKNVKVQLDLVVWS